MRVAIVGAGLMGAQIGCEYALAGHDVLLYARDADAARARADAGLALVEREGLREPAVVAAARDRIGVSAVIDAAAEGADLLVESLPEDLALKTSVLRHALRAAPEAIVATNTSSLSIGAIGDAIAAPERTVGTHYLNPPLLMPTVEVIAGHTTSDVTLALVRDLLVALGKLPVVVRRDVPGFVWNRLQFALVRELAWLVENDVATPEDLDVVVRDGLARRWRTRRSFACHRARRHRHVEPLRREHRASSLHRVDPARPGDDCHLGRRRRRRRGRPRPRTRS